MGKKVAVLDFGVSFSLDHRKVIDKIVERLPVTIYLSLLAIILIVAIAIPLGALSAVRQNSLFDHIVSIVVFIGFAITSFWLVLILMGFLELTSAGYQSPVCVRSTMNIFLRLLPSLTYSNI